MGFWVECGWGAGGVRVSGSKVMSPVRSSAARAAHRDARPLPHLLQRGHVCEAMVVSLGA